MDGCSDQTLVVCLVGAAIINYSFSLSVVVKGAGWCIWPYIRLVMSSLALVNKSKVSPGELSCVA